MLTQVETDQIFENLAQLGGKAFKEEDITYDGSKIQLPEQWRGNLGKGVDFLRQKMKEEEAIASFSRTYNYRPLDGGYNAFQALKKAFGMVQGKTTYSFFGPNPPQYIQVPISVSETEEVPWGQFSIPLLENTEINFHSHHDAERGALFGVHIDSPRKNRFVIEGIFKIIEEELKSFSIYKGKAIDGREDPQFVDLSGVDPSKIVYDQQVEAELNAHVWGFIEHNEAFIQMGMPNKRSILLTGPYGTGKTLTANATALKAVANHWTFIMARPGRDNFFQVMQTAKLYQPAVVFMEDADTIANENENDTISQLLDVFDGIQAKNTRMMVVLTTNHPEKLTEGMRRPGRIDQLITIGNLDRPGIEKLFRIVLGDRLAPDVDFDKVAEVCADYLPAFIKEAADKSIRYAVVRNEGSIANLKITTDDIVHAAAGSLREQWDWMTRKVEKEESRYNLKTIVEEASKKGVATLAPAAVDASKQVWNKEELATAQKNGH